MKERGRGRRAQGRQRRGFVCFNYLRGERGTGNVERREGEVRRR